MHADGGRTIDRSSGTRAATTLRNEPRASPGAKASAAKIMALLSARLGGAVRRVEDGGSGADRDGAQVDDAGGSGHDARRPHTVCADREADGHTATDREARAEQDASADADRERGLRRSIDPEAQRAGHRAARPLGPDDERARVPEPAV